MSGKHNNSAGVAKAAPDASLSSLTASPAKDGSPYNNRVNATSTSSSYAGAPNFAPAYAYENAIAASHYIKTQRVKFVLAIVAAIAAVFLAVATAFASSANPKESIKFHTGVESIASNLSVSLHNDAWSEENSEELQNGVPISWQPYIHVDSGVKAYAFMAVEVPCASSRKDSAKFELETYEGWTVISDGEPTQKLDGGYSKTTIYSYDTPVEVDHQTAPITKNLIYTAQEGSSQRNLSISLEAMAVQAEGIKNASIAWDAFVDQETNGSTSSSYESILYKDSGDGVHTVTIDDSSIVISDNFSLFAGSLVPGVEQGGVISLANNAAGPQHVQISVEPLLNGDEITGGAPIKAQALIEKTQLTVSINGEVVYNGSLDVPDGLIDLGVLNPDSQNVVSYSVLLDKYAQEEVVGTNLGMQWSFLSTDYVAPDDPDNPDDPSDDPADKPNDKPGNNGVDNDTTKPGTDNSNANNGNNGEGSSTISSTPKTPMTITSAPVRNASDATSLSNTGDGLAGILIVASIICAIAAVVIVVAARKNRKRGHDEY